MRHDDLLYRQAVRGYYDDVAPLHLKYLGWTYQAGLVKTASDAAAGQATNLFCASRASIRPGDRILDAGCGLGGPALDIARAFAGVRVDAITLSPVQARYASSFARHAGLADRVRVCVADFHSLPFASGVFDVALFLESIGYAYDVRQLLAEVYRVLRPGGALYIKGVFQREPVDSARERAALAEFDQAYVHRTPRAGATVEAIGATGFRDVESDDLSDMLSTEAFVNANVVVRDGVPNLTELGLYHSLRRLRFGSGPPVDPLDRPIVRFTEIRGRKPL
jgi:ubiquinone/menaquinone biosynthesis C-methylase UbiE